MFSKTKERTWRAIVPRNEKHPSTNFRYRSLAGEYCIEAEPMIDMGIEPFKSGRKQAKQLQVLLA